jgi:hypothetical protein
MPKKARKRSTSSLAGWLFADLSIVLMILFASTGLTSDDLRCDKDGETVLGADCKATSSSTSTTIEPGVGGVRFQPIIVIIDQVFSRSSASFQQKIEKEIDTQAQSRADLSTASTWDYGVIIIYGGAKGRSDSRDGDKSAEIALRKIYPSAKSDQIWRRIRPSTFFDGGHDSSVPYGSVKLKLFPIIAK